MSEQQKDPTAVERENTPQDQGTGPKDPGRRDFLKIGVLSAATGAALAAGGAALLPDVIEGKEHGDFPVPVRDDYKPVDQRRVIHVFTNSRRVRERYPERVKAWEQGAKKLRDKDFKVEGSFEKYWHAEPKDKTGYTQLDHALEKAAWNTSLTQAGMHAATLPNQGVFTWDQSDVAEKQWQFKSKEEASMAIKSAARLYGAMRCGITRRDRRWDYDPLYDFTQEKELSWEKDFPFEPKTVIVCLAEMDYVAMSTAPALVASATAAQGYSDMTVIAGQLAKFLRLLGYKAVGAGNDLGLNVAYAVAAGLGESGRHGQLIAPQVGPRVRICKVYTDLDFVEYDKPRTFGILDFCINCKRCADACPSQAISHDDERGFEPVYAGSDDPNYTFNNNPGVMKWHNDMKKCFEFWTENGGDCGACIASCPYNKPDFWHHRMMDTMNQFMPGPLHWVMKESDRLFGYGKINDPGKVKDFWQSGERIET